MAGILLIEDDDGDADMVCELLGRDVQVHRCRNLDEGVQVLARGGIEVVLLDLSLPDSQGIDSVATTHVFDSETPIIVMTGLDDEELALRAIAAGAHDYLIKGQTDARALRRSIGFAKQRVAAERRMPPASERPIAAARGIICPPGGGFLDAIAKHVAHAPGIVYAAADRPGPVVMRGLAERGITARLEIVDLNAKTPEEGGVAVEEAAARLGGRCVVLVDSVNSLLLHHHVDATAAFCHTLANRLRLLGVSVDLLIHDTREWPYIADRLSFLDGFEDLRGDAPADPSFA